MKDLTEKMMETFVYVMAWILMACAVFGVGFGIVTLVKVIATGEAW